MANAAALVVVRTQTRFHKIKNQSLDLTFLAVCGAHYRTPALRCFDFNFCLQKTFNDNDDLYHCYLPHRFTFVDVYDPSSRRH
jgi:hypothetical protein